MDEHRLQRFPNPPRYVPFRPPQSLAGSGGGPDFFHSPHDNPQTHFPLPPYHRQLPPPPPPNYGLRPRHPASPLSPSPITQIQHQYPLPPNVPFHHQQRLVDSPSRHPSRHGLDHPPPPPTPIHEATHLRRGGYELHQHHHQHNRTHRTEEFPHPPPRVFSHGGQRSPPRLPRFDNRSFRSDYAPSCRDPIDGPIRQQMSRMGLTREVRNRSPSPPFVRMGGQRNQQEHKFRHDEQMRWDRRNRETDATMRIHRENGDRCFFRKDGGREGPHLREIAERDFLMRPDGAETERRDQNSRNGVHSLIEGGNRGTDNRDGYSELSERGKTRVLDSGRYGDRDRWEDGHDHRHSPNKRLERKKPSSLRMQLDTPSVRNRNDSSSITQKGRDSETQESQNLSFRRDRESSPMVSSSRTVADKKHSPGDLKKINKSLSESSNHVLPVDSPGIKICCENELSSMEVEKEPKLSLNIKETVSVPVEKNVLRGADSESVPREADGYSGNGNYPQPPEWKDSNKDSTCSGSGKESFQNIGDRREHMTHALSPSSAVKQSLADEKVHISSDSADNATVIDYVGHLGDCKKLNEVPPEPSVRVLPVDSVGQQSEMTSESKICSVNELSSPEEEDRPKVCSIVKDFVSVEKSIPCGVVPNPVPSMTNISSGDGDRLRAPKCKESDRDSVCSGSGKESSPQMGKKRKLLTSVSSADSGKKNSSGKKVDLSSLLVDDLVIDCVRHFGEDPSPAPVKEGRNYLNKAVVEYPSVLKDKKTSLDSASEDSSASPVKRRIISFAFPSSSQIDRSFGNGESTSLNFDEFEASFDSNDWERSFIHQDVGPSLVDPGSSVKSLAGHISLENSADIVMLTLGSRKLPERVANVKNFMSGACTAAANEGDLPGKMPTKFSSIVNVFSSSISKVSCESNTPLSPEGGAFSDSRKAEVLLDGLSYTPNCSGLEDFHHFEKEAISGVSSSKNGNEVVAGNAITYSQSSEGIKHVHSQDLMENQSCQFQITESLANVASRVPPEASNTARAELGSLISKDDTLNCRRRIQTLDSGINRVKDNDRDFLTLGSSVTVDLAQDETVTELEHDGEELESSVRKDKLVNENELMVRPQGIVIPSSDCVQSEMADLGFLCPIRKTKFLSSVTKVLHSVPADIYESLSSMEETPHDPQVPLDVVNASPHLAGQVEASSAEPIFWHSTTALSSKGTNLSNSFAGGNSTATDLVEVGCSDGCSAAHKLAIPDNIVFPSMVEFPGVASPVDACDTVVSGNRKDACIYDTAMDCDVDVEGERPGGTKLTNYVDPKVQDADTSRDIKIPVEESLASGSGCLPVLVHSTFDDCAVNKSPKNCISESVSVSQPSLNMSSVAPKADNIYEKKLLVTDKISDKRLATVLPSIPKCNVASSAVGLKANGPTAGKQENSGKTASLPSLSHITRTTPKSVEVSMNQQIWRNNGPRYASGKVMSGRSSFVAPNRKPTVHVTKPRTWRRTDAPPPAQPTLKKLNAISPPMQKPSHIQGVQAQNISYIRKGNSLVRNPASASSEGQPADTFVNQLNCSPSHSKVTSTEISKASSPPWNIGLSNPSYISLGDSSTEISKASSPPWNIGLSNPSYISLGDCRSSPSSDSFPVIETDPHRSPESLSKSLRNADSDTDNKFEDQSMPSDSNQATSDVNRVVYIKRKSNQLVAAQKHSQAPIPNVDGAKLSSKVYYKRKRNQLVRASSESHTQLKTIPNDGSNLNRQKVLKPYTSRIASKRQANKVRKTSGGQKLSLVWTLCGAQPQKKLTNSLRRENVLPHLLPWKRATYISKSPSSFFSHKLLTSKRRKMIYTRSGFSLRRSKVVSVAGCSLKWSKSLEKRSKKAEKEAALAINAMKKGKKGMDSGATIGKSRSNVSRERIYRIGNFRYKMVPSRRTLQRISDEESSSVVDGQHSETVKSRAVPKRLLIGHEEYVRIGSGNQLVRNPKRRTRIIASERVRWSLHTARMRLAKRRKYCQFFTRFGKCNKAEGRCPYIHDESKVSVCTKFLNDLCSDPDCKLTHKVIPERMPDCSFFLQGLCSNENCPYRHVNVNPKAAICENFLKGYCDEGDECRKKHSYSCPAFEVTGECPEGSKCKLYHPKKGKYNGKGRVLKQYQKSSWVRYFNSGITNLAELEEKEVTTAKQCSPKATEENMTVGDGSLADFISLEGYSDVEDEEPDYPANKQAVLSNSSRLQLGDTDDERIKPIRLLG